MSTPERSRPIASTHGPERHHYWYTRGRKDGLRGAALMSFSDPPDRWDEEDVKTALMAYHQGLDTGYRDREVYVAIQREMREAENLAASRDTNDPHNAREMARLLQEELTTMELDRSDSKPGEAS